MMRGLRKKLGLVFTKRPNGATQSEVRDTPTEKADVTANGASSSPSDLPSEDFPQPQWGKFEDANAWEPDKHQVLYCMNGQDNVPARMKLKNDFVYYISQSRSPGHKDQGQDCMATASHGNWEVDVLCDGHDKLGHMVAMGICQQLPRIMLRRIHERENAQTAPNEEVSDKVVSEAFDEAARVVCWTSENITVGIWVKVFDGQWQDKPGYIKEANGQGKVRVAIIDENGYHLPSLDKKSLRRPRYTGGCTCLCLIRNKETRECKIAVSGDSRLLILPNMGLLDAVLVAQSGVEKELPNDAEPAKGLITPAHNVFNEDERERLERDFPGQYEFDGNFLVNPITKFAIQPTRGFGDFDMYGTGYTHSPEITKTFVLEPNALIFAASDGVFDSHVWADEEIVSCLDKYIEDGLTSSQIVDNMYRETLQRSFEGGYVDDISIFCFKEPGQIPEDTTPAPVKEPEIKNQPLPKQGKVKQKKNVRNNRKTIGRGDTSLDNLHGRIETLKKQRLEEEEKAKGIPAEEAAGTTDDLEEKKAEILEGVGTVMENLAISHQVEDKVDTEKILEEDAAEEAEEEEDKPPPANEATDIEGNKDGNQDDTEEDKAAENLI